MVLLAHSKHQPIERNEDANHYSGKNRLAKQLIKALKLRVARKTSKVTSNGSLSPSLFILILFLLSTIYCQKHSLFLSTNLHHLRMASNATSTAPIIPKFIISVYFLRFVTRELDTKQPANSENFVR